MDRFIYTAYSGMRGSMAAQTAIANNLANANTIGFRADRMSVEAHTVKGSAMDVRSPTGLQVKDADLTAGAIIATGRALDIAVDGDAMIAVQAGNGDEAYTRRGDLMVSPAGMLQTGDGHMVIGQGGPISVPAAASLSISPDGTITMVPEGGDPNNAETVDRIKLASPRGSNIAKGLDGLFRVAGGGALPADLDARAITGALEQSNVNSAQMLVDMIENQRLFDIRTKLISTAQTLDEGGASLMRIS